MAILLTKEMNQQLSSLSSGPRSLWEKIRERPRWRWSAIAAAALLILIGVRVHESRVAAAKGKTKGPMAVPVGAAQAVKGDIPVFLDGLGNVIAFYTVTVHSRVDGQLMSVGFTEGQTIHDGDLLAQIDPRPYQAALDQAEGQLARDQSLLADAKLDLERYKDLVAQNAIPKQQLDTQVATVGQYEGAVKNDQGTVEAAKVNLAYTRITSPINGRVGLRLVDPGNIVHASDANGLLVITQLQPIAVVFTLPEDSAPKVMRKFSAGAKLQAKAFNRDKSQLLATGVLLTPDNQMDPTTGTLKLKAVFDNKENTLFPNQFVNIRLLLDTLHNQVIAPAAAIQRGSQGTFVYVVKPDQTVDARPVTVGVTEGLDASFDSGLSAGETVVVDGADNLQPGSTVSVGAPTPIGGVPAQPRGPSKS